jgi:hypothetical protein
MRLTTGTTTLLCSGGRSAVKVIVIIVAVCLGPLSLAGAGPPVARCGINDAEGGNAALLDEVHGLRRHWCHGNYKLQSC